MTDSRFYTLGRLAGGKVRKVKWMWSSLTGDETEAIGAEYGVGWDMAAVVRERNGCDADPALQTLLDDIRDRLADVVRNKLHRFEVSVVTDDQPTAYALPGGFIFLTRALTELCERDRDEVAFVVAHEMAHVIRRHAINRVLRQTRVRRSLAVRAGTRRHRALAAPRRPRVAGARLLAGPGIRSGCARRAPDAGCRVRPRRGAAAVRAVPATRPRDRVAGSRRLSLHPPPGRRPDHAAAEPARESPKWPRPAC